MEKIKIMLAEDHLVVRNGIRLLLESQSNFEVTAEVSNGMEILQKLEQEIPVDVVITDLSMIGMDGLNLLNELKERQSPLKIIILTMLSCELHVAASFEKGASAYLVKNVSAEELIFCINHVSKGGKYVCEEIMMKLVYKLIGNSLNITNKIDPEALDLTERELEVLELLGQGLTNMEIAKKLFLSKRTVEGHRQNLIEKTQSKNTPSLIKFAVINGLIK